MKTPHLIAGLGLLLNFSYLRGQNYAIGSSDYALPDPARPGRTVQVRLFYPALTHGNNTPWSSGTFPLISFGHGFAMSYTAYQNIWEYFVSRGYAMAMVDMENAVIPPPSHSDFGQDIRWAAKELLNRSANSSTDPIFGRLNGKAAFMGHSMGGGSSVLGAAIETGFPDAVVGLSAAETNPSAVNAASQVTSPCLMLAGEKDMVTPPSQHQVPIFNALGSSCKVYAEIKGGIHCYYALANLACDFGETTSGSQPGISRAQQQQATYDIVEPFLAWHLKNASAGPFLNMLGDNRYSVVNSCAFTNLRDNEENFDALDCIQGSDGLHITFREKGLFSVYNLQGVRLFHRRVEAGVRLHIPDLPSGILVGHLDTGLGQAVRRFATVISHP
ncbi:MAG: hypothetical protein N2050_01770 [Flavobacteriales bacterium]|nr:hypothetical protein [Flavobacteriales bacterium]